MLAIRLPEDIETRLDNLAKRTGRSKTFYARAAIMEYLEDMEDLYLAEQVVSPGQRRGAKSPARRCGGAFWPGGLRFLKLPKNHSPNRTMLLPSVYAAFCGSVLLPWTIPEASGRRYGAANWASFGNTA